MNDEEIRWEEFTFVIPAYNEELAIGGCLTKLLSTCLNAQIIVIDDGSTDNTGNIVKSFLQEKKNTSLLTHDRNRGYGAALKAGIRQSVTEYVIWFDADGQHKVDDVYKLALKMSFEKFDAVIGARDKNSAFQIKRIPGKWFIRVVSQIIARRKIPDLNCGLRIFKRDIIKRYLHLLPNGFSASSTSTLIMLKRNYRVCFKNISTEARLGKSTVKIFRDGFRTVNLLIKILLLFDAFLFFSTAAFIQIAFGLVYSIYKIYSVKSGLPVFGALVMMSGLLTIFMGFISSQISQLRQERFEE